jgi:photosystem II PsbU protein
MQSESEPTVSRRALLTGAVAAALAAALARARPAEARIDYEGIGYLGGGEKIDVNNANVRAYRKYPGLYPTAAKKIVQGGPYSSPDDILKNPELTERDKEVIKKYMDRFVALPPAPEYFTDRVNNGIYK